MRIKNIFKYFLTLTAFAPLLTSCIYDEMQEDFGSDMPEAPSGYMAINLTSGSGIGLPTRAEGFDEGLEEEIKLAPGDHHFAAFYNDQSDYPFAIASLSGLTTVGGKTDNYSMAMATVFANRDKGSDDFSYFNGSLCVVVLNSDITKAEMQNMTKQQLFTREMDGGYLTVGNEKYFTMANAVYLNSNDGNIASEVQVQPQLIFNEASLAMSAALKGQAAATAYVERMMAKLTTTFKFRSGDNIERAADYKKVMVYSGVDDVLFQTEYVEKDWDALLLGYSLNGMEQEGRLFKNISNSTNYFTNWNDVANRRSYWAEDLHYVINNETKMHYPHQYRKGLETDTIRDYQGNHGYGTNDSWDSFNTNNVNYYLRYVSFDEMNGSKLNEIYTLENTYNDASNLLWQYGYFNAGTHFLVASQLQIEGLNYTDLYSDEDHIFYTDASQVLEAKIKILNGRMLPGGNSGIRVLNADWLNHLPITGDLVEVSWPVDGRLMILEESNKLRAVTAEDFTLVPAEISGGDGRLLIAPKNKTATYYISTRDGALNAIASDEIRPITYNQIISLIHKLEGPIDHFANGYMYYPVPVLHNTTALVPASHKTLGAIGMVRNHWYRISVNSVSRPGRPVDMPAQPIIPMAPDDRDYIDARVEILQWHTIFQGNVPLSPYTKDP